MSPEIFSNVVWWVHLTVRTWHLLTQPYNFKSDVWSFGCCVYEMATYKQAFNARDISALVFRVIQGQVGSNWYWLTKYYIICARVCVYKYIIHPTPHSHIDSAIAWSILAGSDTTGAPNAWERPRSAFKADNGWLSNSIVSRASSVDFGDAEDSICPGPDGGYTWAYTVSYHIAHSCPFLIAWW